MNVYLMVDIEGMSGIYTREQVLPSEGRFSEGRRRMTEDINACVAGLKDAGVEQIWVRDCHGGSYSVLYDALSEEVDYLVCGSSADERFPGLSECDAVILLGYHAMAGTAAAVLEHTWSSRSIQNVWINGTKVGELALDSAIVGEAGKPVIMVSGDDKLCIEARGLLPSVVTAEVKRGLSCFGAVLLPRARALRLIRERACEAVRNAANCKPFTYSAPIALTVERVERTQLPSMRGNPGLVHDGGRTYTVIADTVLDALYKASL